MRRRDAVARPQQRKFLGFSFTDGPEIKRAIATKALERFKHRIREVTLRAKGVSLETTIAELAPDLRGSFWLTTSLRKISCCGFAGNGTTRQSPKSKPMASM